MGNYLPLMTRMTRLGKFWVILEGYYKYVKVFAIYCSVINPSLLDRGQRQKTNVNFYFHTLRGGRRFYEGFKSFIKPFDSPQRSVRIKIYIIVCFNTNF